MRARRCGAASWSTGVEGVFNVTGLRRLARGCTCCRVRGQRGTVGTRAGVDSVGTSPVADAVVGILVGSESDRERMQSSTQRPRREEASAYAWTLRSAHQTPGRGRRVFQEAAAASAEIGVLICGAGLSAALPGVVCGAHRPAGDRSPAPLGASACSTASTRCSRSRRMPPSIRIATVGVDDARDAAALAGADSRRVRVTPAWRIRSRPEVSATRRDQPRSRLAFRCTAGAEKIVEVVTKWSQQLVLGVSPNWGIVSLRRECSSASGRYFLRRWAPLRSASARTSTLCASRGFMP